MDGRKVLEKLDTSMDGLNERHVPGRLEKYGYNELEDDRKIPWGKILASQLKSPFSVVLAIAAFISLLAHHGKNLVDTIIIAGVITFNTFLGFSQEFKAEKSLQALKKLAAREAWVIREDGETGESHEVKIKARELVPGDIVIVNTGDKIPADIRFLESHDLKVDESMLTGESRAVKKRCETLVRETSIHDRANMGFMGTIITRGRGLGVVVATGERTEMGKISSLIRETEEAGIPIKERIVDLSKRLGFLALLLAILSFVLALISIGYVNLAEVFLFSIASAISSIPEGLPAVLTITLAIGVNRMARRNGIIRKLQAVDTLGCISAICTDKTGTLTTNQMTVREIHVGGTVMNVSGVGYAPEGEFAILKTGTLVGESTELDTMLKVGLLCCDAKIQVHQGSDDAKRETRDDAARWELIGDPTEGALVVAAAKRGLLVKDMERIHPRMDEIPFDSNKKFMVTFNENGNGQVLACMKGAVSKVIACCSRIIKDGVEMAITQADVKDIHEQENKIARKGMRVLAIACTTIPLEELSPLKNDFTRQAKLTFLGVIGIIDPPRLEVEEAISACKRAGIHVCVATGDHALTGATIAKEVGILNESQPDIITGEQMDAMSDLELDAKIDRVAVFARVSPRQKHRIVLSLQRKGHVVAMTGDGINDTPALKAAEIGIAMGLTGSDVAKDTADLILTDDNFASIVAAVEEGRAVFQNIRKVTKYLLSTNIGEDITILAALIMFIGAPLIFTPVQILWVNLVTDGVLDVTLSMEPTDEDVMDVPPRPSDEHIINREIMRNTFLVATIMAIGSLAVFAFFYDPGIPESIYKARTFSFTTLAMFQVFNALNCRSRQSSVFRLKLKANPYLLIAIGISIMLQVLVTTVPALETIFGIKSLTISDWLLIIAISSSVLWIDELRKRLTSG
ncbi:HAD-IC family P-type ATPase [Candidatus Bathyarchaeota archaeon]|nr:HAD-IC family P-type ATPase [Candidatus Bathyarchaeota archaeon]